MILKNYKLWRCDNTNVVIKSSYLLEIYTETFMDKMEWCHGFSSKMTWKGEANRDMGDPAWPRVELWSWVTDTRKLLSPARLLLCLKFLHTENVSVYENASRALHCTGSQRLAPATCLRLHDTWRPLRPSACDPHSAPITYPPVSNTPPCAIFGGEVEGGFAFSVPRCLTRLSPSPPLNRCLNVPFSMMYTQRPHF